MIILLLLLTFSLRFYGLNWDQGFHLHPDERMIIMVADRLRLPQTTHQWQTVTTPQSSLNPKFFAYGSLPIYLLKSVSSLLKSDTYDRMLYTGRYLSILFELGTVLLIYKIATIVLSEVSNHLGSSPRVPPARCSEGTPRRWDEFPFIAAFFYAISTLAIQSAHFYISDVPLIFFTTLTLYFLTKLSQSKKALNISWKLGIAIGLTLATKITAVLLIIPTAVALIFHFLKSKSLHNLILFCFITVIFSLVAFALTMPYALIDFSTFKTHLTEQSRMRVDPFVFPFTLQYVNTTPYWYFVKNLILWGMGLPLGILTVLGTIYTLALWSYQMSRRFVKKQKISPVWNSISVLIVFFLVYFAFMGKSAVKFMRYLLPVYPLLCIFGSLFLFQLTRKLKALKPHQRCVKTLLWCEEIRIDVGIVIIFFALFISTLWPLSFINIYAKPHTRVVASEWIYKNIPANARLAVEHWDDRLPLPLPNIQKAYQYLELPLYEADTESKWKNINEKLEKADYIIIASNRLYVPLMRLTDCENLPPGRCYRLTAKYYQDLFEEKLDFVKAAEFTSYPSFPPFPLSPLSPLSPLLTFIDDSADEIFTVYDHPKVIIFKKSL